MNWLQKISENEQLQNKLFSFLSTYDISGLEQALQLYEDTQQYYICKTKISISKVRISEIYYLEINGHNITIHTERGDFYKYGSLNEELKILSQYGFIKCRQNCVVSLAKIKSIDGFDIVLINGEKIHMSKKLASKVILTFTVNTASINVG